MREFWRSSGDESVRADDHWKPTTFGSPHLPVMLLPRGAAMADLPAFVHVARRDIHAKGKPGMQRLLLVALVLLSGCGSTGVVPMGQNMYSISKTSAACGFRDAGGVRADIYKEMGAFCERKGLASEVVSIEALDGVVGRRCASATVEFRCVSATAPNTAPTSQRPDRDMNRDPSTAADRGQFGRKSSDPIKIQQDVRMRQSDDMYAELKKLKELLDSGIITQEEFDARKRKILAE